MKNKSRTMETERLLLRELRVTDAADVFEWTGDPIVNTYMPYSLYQNVEQVEKWLAALGEDENNYEFAFCLKDTGKVIGSGSIGFCSKRKEYEFGYNFNRAYWGKGYATEAAKAMIQWAYTQLGARDFGASAANDNVASNRVIQKCGLTFDHYGRISRFDGSETWEASFYKMHLE